MNAHALDIPAGDEPARPVEPARQLDPAGMAEANINPATGLATDYLNHFNEAIMVLELLPQMPDCIEDLIVWHPMSYPEHFAASTFRDRELAIAAYELAEPSARLRLDELAETMNAILIATRDAMRKTCAVQTAELLARARCRQPPTGAPPR